LDPLNGFTQITDPTDPNYTSTEGFSNRIIVIGFQRAVPDAEAACALEINHDVDSCLNDANFHALRKGQFSYIYPYFRNWQYPVRGKFWLLSIKDRVNRNPRCQSRWRKKPLDESREAIRIGCLRIFACGFRKVTGPVLRGIAQHRVHCFQISQSFLLMQLFRQTTELVL